MMQFRRSINAGGFRVVFLALIATTAAVWSSSTSAEQSSPSNSVHPNVVLIVTDNHGAWTYSTADGFHPAGAVIDEKRGVQHIFVCAGHPNGPAGVFRITRTLDTPKLAAFLNGTSHK